MSVVDRCLMPPSWLGSRKPLAIMWYCSQVLMTFSTSLPVVLSKTMGRKDFGVL